MEQAPWSYTDDTVLAARVAFTLMAFNVAQTAKTAQAQQLPDCDIRRFRRELVPEYGPAPVIVFTKEAFGVFHIEVREALALPQPSLCANARIAQGLVTNPCLNIVCPVPIENDKGDLEPLALVPLT